MEQVPLAVSHPPAELAYVLEHSGASAVLSPAGALAQLAPTCAAAGAALHEVEHSLLAAAAAAHPLNSARGDGGEAAGDAGIGGPADAGGEEGAGALILYTSGTTGRPKGALHTQRSLLAGARSMAAAWQLHGGRLADRLLHCLPLHHTHGLVNGVIAPHLVGAAVEFAPRFSPAAVWERLARHGAPPISLFFGVPTTYAHLIAHWERQQQPAQRAASSAAAGALRLAVCGSAACPPPILARWRDISGQARSRRRLRACAPAATPPLPLHRRPSPPPAALAPWRVQTTRRRCWSGTA